MTKLIIAYVASLLAMAACDSVWLTLTAGPLYRAHLGALLAPSFAPVPAVAFYLLYGVGVVVFAVAPALALSASGWRFAATRGGFFGTVAYATYDLTNQATLAGWSTTVTLADIAWGTVLTGAAASMGFAAARRLGGRAAG